MGREITASAARLRSSSASEGDAGHFRYRFSATTVQKSAGSEEEERAPRILGQMSRAANSFHGLPGPIASLISDGKLAAAEQQLVRIIPAHPESERSLEPD